MIEIFGVFWVRLRFKKFNEKKTINVCSVSPALAFDTYPPLLFF